jgi:hypothetical protein
MPQAARQLLRPGFAVAAVLAYAVSYLPGESHCRLTAFFILDIIALSVLLTFFEEYHAQKELDAPDKLLLSYFLKTRFGIDFSAPNRNS